MMLKIFKSTIYTLLAVLCIHSYATSQGLPPEKEKEIEAKMKQMEAKLQAMQVKLDSLKAKDSMNSFSGLAYTNNRLRKALKAMPKMSYKATPSMPALPPAAQLQSFQTQTQMFQTQTSGESFQGLNKSMNGNFSYSYDSSDKNLSKRIKNGEAKEKVKNYSKSYSARSGDELNIDNRYGKVTINTWNKNEFKVDIEIKGIADGDDEAQKLLDGITISDSKDGSTIYFKTTFQSKSSNFWESWNNGSRTSVHKQEVNYTVYMPSKNALTLSNAYGATILPDFDGKLIVKSSYGSLVAKTLTNPDNELTCRYGSANIDNLKGSNLNVAYGSLNLGSSDNINATISYSSAKIAKIKTSGTINMKYGGGLRIGELDNNFKSLTVNSNYSSVIVGLDNDPNFNFDVSVSYGSFNYGDHQINLAEKSADDDRRYSSTKTYKGHLGKGSADRLITINSRFGSVKFD